MDSLEQTYLLFVLNNEIFAINIANVTEVIEIRSITKVPRTIGYMRGVLNLRGEVIPVLSLRLKLNIPEINDNINTVIIIIELMLNEKRIVLGIVADKVIDVIEFNNNEVLPVPDISSNYNPSYLNGMKKHDNSFIMLLNINNIITSTISNKETELHTA